MSHQDLLVHMRDEHGIEMLSASTGEMKDKHSSIHAGEPQETKPEATVVAASIEALDTWTFSHPQGAPATRRGDRSLMRRLGGFWKGEPF